MLHDVNLNIVILFPHSAENSHLLDLPAENFFEVNHPIPELSDSEEHNCFLI